MAVRLISCNGLKNEASKSEKLPARLKVFEWGTNKTIKGDFEVNDQTVQVFNANQAKIGRGNIVLDYEHNTVPGSTEYERTKEPRDVAAHLSCSVVPQDGVYCEVLNWTESGKESAKNYIDLSPAFYTDGKGVLIGMHSVALTNTGAMIDLQFLAADAGTPFDNDLQVMSATADVIAATQKGGGSPLLQLSKSMNKDQMEVCRKFLGMDGKSDEEVLKCMADEVSGGKIIRKGPLDTAAGAEPKVLPIAGDFLANAGLRKMVADTFKELLEPVALNVTKLSDAATAQQKETDKAARAALVAQASRDGKVIPLSAAEIAITPIALLQSIVTGLPKSTLKTTRSAEALANKSNPDGKISNGQTITLSIDGQQIPIVVNSGGTTQVKGAARRSTVSNFDDQLAALQRK